MKNIATKILICSFCILLFCNACNQSSTGRSAQMIDTVTAVAIAEPILFDKYGKEKIIKQKPYNIQYKEGCWLIGGTMHDSEKGGTFLIVIDSRDGKIIEITHGK